MHIFVEPVTYHNYTEQQFVTFNQIHVINNAPGHFNFIESTTIHAL